MIRLFDTLKTVAGDRKGSMVIETAIVLPVLVMLCLGGFEVSRLVSRNNELQIAVAEAGSIVLASLPEDQSDIDKLEEIIETSTGLPADKVTLVKKYRCNSDASLVVDLSTCPTGAVISEFIEIEIADWYTPLWTDFGVGNTVNYDLTRRVQIS
ncbi:TadE/TadG family type IV pilus assembly protein [Qipengyuania huizhouensis]|uniref:TadE/TadG family type IV pilus assembly protein n=1 Tax=Qipengyuania huizhouensis TaxID=2867245 RepID=UPI001C88B138|nr:pilus assembly protein [Qipengyuania huizhouensis]